MKRVHLFELEDQEWFPNVLRNYGTDFLSFMSNRTKLYEGVVPIISKGLRVSHTNTIIDIGSGGGGGIRWLNSQLRKEFPNLKIILTDYYPNISSFEYLKNNAKNIDYLNFQVDARNVPAEYKGLRTQFLSFHHFKPIDARNILQNAVDNKSSIFIFESQERNITSLIKMLFSPLIVLLATPFIRPFKIGRIFFTYVIPIIPLYVLWDSMVSCLRTYSIEELKSMINTIENSQTFSWEIDRITLGPNTSLYLLGTFNSK